METHLHPKLFSLLNPILNLEIATKAIPSQSMCNLGNPIEIPLVCTSPFCFSSSLNPPAMMRSHTCIHYCHASWSYHDASSNVLYAVWCQNPRRCCLPPFWLCMRTPAVAQTSCGACSTLTRRQQRLRQAPPRPNAPRVCACMINHSLSLLVSLLSHIPLITYPH